MARLPSIRRISIEEFKDQASWIGKLLQPLNTFLETSYRAFDGNLTLADNMQAEIREIEVESATPNLKLQRSDRVKLKPTCITVGNVQRSNGAVFTLSTAVQVQWELTSEGGIKITNVIGITPSSSTKYKLTLAIFTQ